MFALFALSVSLLAAEPLPSQPLWIRLGPANEEHGLASPSGGDGASAAETVAGSPCRQISGGNSHYMYFKADASLAPPGDYDAYLTVEYFDDRIEVARVEYDKAPLDRDENSFYTLAEDLILLTGSREWRRAVVHLPQARCGHGQNFAADFRLMGRDLAVRRVDLSFTRPSGYRAGGIDAEELKKFAASIGRGMELDIGDDTDRGESALFRVLGATSAESYVTWQSVEDAGEGKWDWSHWDRQVEILRRAGLKWAPLVVCGPAYALPEWYRESPRSVPYVCLEHGEASKIQSLWNPALRPWVERFIKAFADRYRDTGMLELVRLGVTGIYGETLYPSGPADGPIFEIPGLFHNHGGWWAGDRFAVASFRRLMVGRYADVAALNRAWCTHYASFDEVRPMLPAKAPSARARLDFIHWYLDSMTEFAAFWSTVVRKHFPNTPVYHSLGGAGEILYGADFSAQARAFAPARARLRVTNEASDYLLNFSITREVVSAGRAFGLDYGFEPAGDVTADGNVARIYNATASGGVHLFCYKGNILQNAQSLETFRRNIGFLERRTPVVHAGLYLPKTTWALDDSGRAHDRSLPAARELRKRVDCELLDRTTLATPLAGRIRVLAIFDAEYAEPAEIELLRGWVESGGILVARRCDGQPLLRTPEGRDEPCRSLLAAVPNNSPVLRAKSQGGRHFRVELGAANDTTYLAGDWHASEPAGMFGLTRKMSQSPPATMRWTGARAGLNLPCDPTADATLALTVHLTTRSLPGVNRVLVNGAEVGRLDKPGPRTYRFAVPQRLLAGQTVAAAVLEVKTFHPTDFGNADSRELGMAVHEVQMIARKADDEPALATPLTWEVDWKAAGPSIRRIGRGATFCVPTGSPSQFSEAVVAVLRQPERVVPGAAAIHPAVSDVEGLFVTELSDGFLYYNATSEPHQADGIMVPARGIAWRAK
ncbi:MAG: beta-galactosidase [Thermoguttaceae bacterium]